MRWLFINSRTLQHRQVEDPTPLSISFRSKKLIPWLPPHKSNLRCPMSQPSTLPPLITLRYNFFLHGHLMHLILFRLTLSKFRSISSIQLTIVIINILSWRCLFDMSIIIIAYIFFNGFFNLLLPFLIKSSIILLEILLN